jgi:hypothetical protein
MQFVLKEFDEKTGAVFEQQGYEDEYTVGRNLERGSLYPCGPGHLMRVITCLSCPTFSSWKIHK